MTYVDGGLAVGTAVAILTAWGTSSWAAYYHAGVYTHNQGWARRGKAKLGFRAAAVVLWGIFGQAHFDVRFDNGWMAAKRNLA
ncbi:hypothetical protein ERUR111494_08750 [Erysipelothrix urinaevulpis]|uniref:hypothetical protein n=1 Tax=Erysipelothrix urinaevulpis TaxID=2683717 RepID=UPI001357A964|nr:hypothetical protein [Erysipelothrix urinaevulpis]